jgi:hypothetical protein
MPIETDRIGSGNGILEKHTVGFVISLIHPFLPKNRFLGVFDLEIGFRPKVLTSQSDQNEQASVVRSNRPFPLTGTPATTKLTSCQRIL